MSPTKTMPAQKQEHQPGREREMRPKPDYTPKYPASESSPVKSP